MTEGLELLPDGTILLRFEEATVALRHPTFGEFVSFRMQLDSSRREVIPTLGANLDWLYAVADQLGVGEMPARSEAPLWLASASTATSITQQWMSAPVGGPWSPEPVPPSAGRVPRPLAEFHDQVRRIYAAAGERGIAPEIVDRTALWKVGAMLGAGLSEEERQGGRRRGLDREDERRVRQERLAYARGEGPPPAAVPLDTGFMTTIANTTRRN